MIPLESLGLVTLVVGVGSVPAPPKADKARRRFTGGENRTRFSFCVLLDAAVLLTEGDA